MAASSSLGWDQCIVNFAQGSALRAPHKELKYLQWQYTNDIGIQMNRKEQTKTFRVVFIENNPLDSMVLTKITAW